MIQFTQRVPLLTGAKRNLLASFHFHYIHHYNNFIIYISVLLSHLFHIYFRVTMSDNETEPRKEISLSPLAVSKSKSLSPAASPIQKLPENDPLVEKDQNEVDSSTDFKVQTVRKRVPGKFVDKFWAPLEPETFDSLERIISVCTSKTIERYRRDQTKTKFNKKMANAQEILATSWADTANKTSFLSRLKVTKLPLPSSHSKRNLSESANVLGFDSLNRRKKFLETYLLAEIKQVNDLERYHKELTTIYKQDQTYLDEFKKTTEIEIKSMTEEAAELRAAMGLTSGGKKNNTPIIKKPVREFNANEDKSTRELLQEIHDTLNKYQNTMETLTETDEKLEVLYNILDMEE